VVRGNTTSGGGTAVTPRPMNPSDAAAGATCERTSGSSGVATVGTEVDLHADAWNVRAGYQLWLPEGHEWQTSETLLLCVRLGSAPVDSIDLSATLYFTEDG
jgi:hypothetical protein